MEINASEVAAFEIFFGDGNYVHGNCKEDWIKAPKDNVQFVVLQNTQGSLDRIYGLDVYALYGVDKFGRWMSRKDYFELKNTMAARSTIYKGE